MLNQTFQILHQAVEELDWALEKETLKQMEAVYQDKLYFVAFIGRFSAGKSCLLNNLLGQDILPRGVSETTPLLTYIRFGSQERARLHYLNGDVQVLELEQVSELVQQSQKWNLEELDYLEIFLPNDLLAGGMVLLDTPGVGTLIQRHEQLLTSSLALAARVVYVTGGAPSKLDMEQIDAMRRQGFDVLYVRTHCDQVQEQEESASQVIAADLDILQPHGIDAEHCFHLSNQPQSRWYGALEPLRQTLTALGADTEAALERDMKAQLSTLAQRCVEALTDKQTLLEETVQGNAQALEARRQAIVQTIHRLEDEMDRRRSQLEHQTAQCRRTLEGSVQHKLKSEVERSAQRIEDSGEEVSGDEEMQRFLRKEAGIVAQAAYVIINDVLDPVMQEINGDIQLEDFCVDQEGLPKAESYMQIVREQNMESEQLCQLRQHLSTLRSRQEEIALALQEQKDSPAYCQMVQELQEMERVLAELQTQNQELGPYVPQLIAVEDGRMQPSQIARIVGEMADWALLLLPGEAIAQGIIKVGENAKFIKGLSEWIGKTENAVKVVNKAKKADNIKDSLYALGQISERVAKTRTSPLRREKAAQLVEKTASQVQKLYDGRKNLQNQNVPFLEMLTVGYWAERAASHFDRPPKLTVDHEREQEYLRTKRELEDRERRIRQEQYQRKCDLNLFRTEQERRDAQLKSLQVDERKVQAELARQSQEIEQKARQRSLKRWKATCADQYRARMLEQLERTLQSYLAEMPERLATYQARRLDGIAQRLNQEQEAYEAVVSAPDAAAEKLESIQALLEQVRGCAV